MYIYTLCVLCYVVKEWLSNLRVLALWEDPPCGSGLEQIPRDITVLQSGWNLLGQTNEYGSEMSQSFWPIPNLNCFWTCLQIPQQQTPQHTTPRLELQKDTSTRVSQLSSSSVIGWHAPTSLLKIMYFPTSLLPNFGYGLCKSFLGLLGMVYCLGSRLSIVIS